MKYVFTILIGCIMGIAGGWYTVSSSSPDSSSSIADQSNILGAFRPERTLSNDQGTREIYGFQPFWLLDFADTSYEEYLTRFNYFGLQLAPDGTIITMKSAVELEPGWANLQTERVRTILKDMKAKGVETALTVQMVDETSIAELLVAPETTARTMVEEVDPVMREYGFTELNVDIESFAAVDLDTQSRFTTFMKTVYEEVQSRQLGLVSIDVTPISLITQRMISVEQIEPYTDLMVLMTYDYHYGGSPSSGPVAPLGGAGYNRDFDVLTAVRESIKYVPPEKILLGIPTYGYEWKTLTPAYSAAAIPGSGVVRSQRRIEEELATCFTCKVERDEYTRQPYIIFPEEDGFHRIAYYEDAQSLQEKLAIVEEYNLRGAALWALGYENVSIRGILNAQVP